MRKVFPSEIKDFLYGSGPYAGVGVYSGTCPEVAQAILETADTLEEAWHIWLKPTLRQTYAICSRAIELADEDLPLSCEGGEKNVVFWRGQAISF